MSAERAREVAESACNRTCAICALYVRTGHEGYRPTTRDEYMAGLRRSYPNGIPAQILPAWAEVTS